jgi:hypothetical protein
MMSIVLRLSLSGGNSRTARSPMFHANLLSSGNIVALGSVTFYGVTAEKTI